MAIAFVVEDGTRKTDATSYVALADAQQYWDNMGYDYSALTDDQFKALLNFASKVIDGQYFSRFKGYRSSLSQALQWPRADVWYPDGYEVGGSTIPPQLKSAVCEMAYAKNAGVDPQPSSTVTGEIQSESTRVDVIQESRTYVVGSTRDHPRLPAVDDALRPLLGGGRYGSIPYARAN